MEVIKLLFLTGLENKAGVISRLVGLGRIFSGNNGLLHCIEGHRRWVGCISNSNHNYLNTIMGFSEMSDIHRLSAQYPATFGHFH